MGTLNDEEIVGSQLIGAISSPEGLMPGDVDDTIDVMGSAASAAAAIKRKYGKLFKKISTIRGEEADLEEVLGSATSAKTYINRKYGPLFRKISTIHGDDDSEQGLAFDLQPGLEVGVNMPVYDEILGYYPGGAEILGDDSISVGDARSARAFIKKKYGKLFRKLSTIVGAGEVDDLIDVFGQDALAEALDENTEVFGDAASARAYINKKYGKLFKKLSTIHGDEPDMDGILTDGVAPVANATKAIITAARDMKSPCPPLAVVPYEEIEDDGLPIDPGGLDYVAQSIIVGESGGVLPLTEALRKHFADEAANPNYIRIDTPEAYKAFRESISKDVADLKTRVDHLEQALADHMADGHGGVPDIIMGLASDISRLQAEGADKRVPLQLPPWCEGKVDCWREGNLICVSIALPGPDGDVRVATSATPVEKHVEDVVGCANETGGDVTELLGVLPTIACMMGGGSLLTRMCGAAPSLLARPEVRRGDDSFVGKIVPAGRPGVAALTALCQLAQSGAPQAKNEWQKLALAASRSPKLAEAMKQACAGLVAGQSKKRAIVGAPQQKYKRTCKSTPKKGGGWTEVCDYTPTQSPINPIHGDVVGRRTR